MTPFEEALFRATDRPVLPMDRQLPKSSYIPIDLSSTNGSLAGISITDPRACERYIHSVLDHRNAKVAFGGYLERRDLYVDKPGFMSSAGRPRNIHLGMDFWAAVGTGVVVPMAGNIHSFGNNDGPGDYGPTILLVHDVQGWRFHTLYGHLHPKALEGIQRGQRFEAGQPLATIGPPECNGGYAPHLHFQIIQNVGDFQGDYPGVCADKDLAWYRNNCPDPNLLLKLRSSD